MDTNKYFNNLSEDQLWLIINNCFANIFVTDAEGEVIFVNMDAAKSLDSTVKELMGKNVRELMKEGITDKSTTLMALEAKERVIDTFTNRSGRKIMTITTPIFGDDGQIIMAVTFSRLQSDMDMFVDELKKERSKTKQYKQAVEYFDRNTQQKNEMVFRSNIMKEICNTAKVIAPTDTTVIIYGESGTGKEVLANFIHSHSNRSHEIFVPVNCAAIPSELLESEFFGYERGAFTGASSKGKAGLFEVANKGTLFLDEIGELPMPMQSKLLRCLESGEYRRIGGDKNMRADVRIVAATNRDLKHMIERGEFREDLYYRLNVLPISVPPIRERREDIEELSLYFLEKMNRKHNKRCTISEEDMGFLCKYEWPGNIRELKNIIERYVVTDSPMVIKSLNPEGLVGTINVSVKLSGDEKHNISVEEVIPLKKMMNDLEKEYIAEVLKLCDNNVKKAAELLDVHRSLIYRKKGE